jgi:hypothetical protein
VVEPGKELAGATPNDRPNQNERRTDSYIHILKLHIFHAKFKYVVLNLKNKDTN